MVQEELTGHGRAMDDEYVQTVAPKAPITYERFVSTHALDKIPKPNVPRAVEAVDADHPHGTPCYKTNGYSVLQQHVMFFDRNKDGVIYPWETFVGFRAIGFNRLISFLAMVIINGAFSYATLELVEGIKCTQSQNGAMEDAYPGWQSWIPSLLFPIYIKNIHKAKHGSDTEVYDTEGRFVPEKFEELFSKFAKRNKTRLDFDELLALTNANMNAYDLFGWVAEKLEWTITYALLKDADGFVSKEQIRGMYDGSLFEIMAQQTVSTKVPKD